MDLELRDADSVQLAYGGGILFGWMHLWGGWWDVENRARGRRGRTLGARKNAEDRTRIVVFRNESPSPPST